MLKVYTAPRWYAGTDRLDITRQGNDPFGVTFAPSWDILKRFRAAGDFEGYIAAYQEEMQRSHRLRLANWLRLLAMKEVTLVCFCATKRCHRYLLSDILVDLGAEYCGDRPPPPPKPVPDDGQISIFICGRGR